MEASGLIVGILGLFNNAVDCFEYVQLGRNFGSNFQTDLLTLDIARLRLSRWGRAVGLSGNIDNVESLQATTVPKDNIPKAERVLGQILKLFADAQVISREFQNRAGTETSTTSSPEVFDVQTNMTPVGRSLHEKMRSLSIKRQNTAPLSRKVKWALYEERHFKKLIDDIIALINDLVQVFPAVQREQHRLCELEVSEIGTHGSLSILKGIAAAQDRDLEAAISDALKQSEKPATTFNNYNSKIGQVVGTANVYGTQSFTIS